MAELEPLRALRYDEAAAGALSDLIAPPYDVVDDREHAALLRRSPHNVVALDQPRAPAGVDPHRHAAALLSEWRSAGLLVREDEPALWALEQRFADPRDGTLRVRRGILGRLRVEPYGAGRIRPHEQTHPEPMADRLALTRATRTNLSPIFVLHPGDAVGPLTEAIGDAAPTATATDLEGTEHRLWRVGDPARIAAAQAALAGAELLIADGHHRYGAALRHVEEDGGPPWILALLVSVEDPGLLILPTHRLLTTMPDDLLGRLIPTFTLTPGDPVPGADRGAPAFGYLGPGAPGGARLTLADPAAAAGLPAAYRDLDTALLEALVLRGPVGLSAADLHHRRGLAYARTADEAQDAVRSGDAAAAFLLRPTPIEQVRAVAAAGLTMPPKSTSFVPKAPAGLLISPLD